MYSVVEGWKRGKRERGRERGGERVGRERGGRDRECGNIKSYQTYLLLLSSDFLADSLSSRLLTGLKNGVTATWREVLFFANLFLFFCLLNADLIETIRCVID